MYITDTYTLIYTHTRCPIILYLLPSPLSKKISGNTKTPRKTEMKRGQRRGEGTEMEKEINPERYRSGREDIETMKQGDRDSERDNEGTGTQVVRKTETVRDRDLVEWTETGRQWWNQRSRDREYVVTRLQTQPSCLVSEVSHVRPGWHFCERYCHDD